MTDHPLSPSESDDLPPETAPATIGVCARGFHDTSEAERFAHRIAQVVREISRWIDLGRLDGITVAYDYDDALAQLDRGYKPTRPLTRTNEDRLVGVAMAPAVIRDGTVKGHLVFHGQIVAPLGGDDLDSPDAKQALYIVAHECGHLEDLKIKDECFPGTILQQPIIDMEHAILEQVQGSTWDEYAACRASAPFGEHRTPIYEESFVSVLATARARANEAIRLYRIHADLKRVMEEAGGNLIEVLRMAAYLFGHLDGRGLDRSFHLGLGESRAFAWVAAKNVFWNVSM